MPCIPIKRRNACGLILHIALLFPITTSLIGQSKENIKFYNVSIKDGLSQSSANCIFQDSQGIMWIGTEDGLNKYDGYTFEVYKPQQDDPYSISSSRILAICEDKHRNLWIGTNGGGLNHYDKKTDSFIKVTFDSLPGAGIINTILVYNEQIWVGSNDGLGLADPDKRQYLSITEYYPGLKPVLNIPVKTLIADDKFIWIGTAEGLFRFDIGRKELTRFNDPDNDNTASVTALLADSYDNLVIGSEANLFTMDKKTGIFNTVKLPGLSTSIRALIEDNNGNIWIGTFGNGLFIGRIQSGQFSNFIYDHLNPYSIRNNEVLSLFRDKAGIIWTGTNGIDIYNPLKEKFTLYDYVPYSREKLIFRNIHQIYEDLYGVLWIASKTDGIHLLDRSNKKYTHFTVTDGLSSNSIRVITEYPDGTIWIGTEDAGFDVIHLNENRIPAIIKNYRNTADLNSVNSNTIYTFYPDRKGNMWIGTDNGLAVMDIESGAFKRYLPDSSAGNSLSNSIVYSIFGDRNDNIWLATDLGVNKYDESSDGFIHFIHDDQNENSINHNEILCFHEDKNGNIWIGTYGKGFDKFNPQNNKFTHFSDYKEVSTAVIYGILEDNQGNLWMSSNNGVMKFSEHTGELKQFDIENGLQSNEFNGSSYFINASGEMFFGGQFGFNSFFPNQVMVDSCIPGIILSDLVVNNTNVIPGPKSPLNQHINMAEEINLNYRQNNFTLYFSALHFGNSLRNRYKYKLEGFDKEWIEAGTKRFASYTNLPYKTYIFRVKASNSDGIWNEEGISIKVRIKPPLWATTAFRIFSGLVLIGGIIFLVKRRITHDERQKTIIEEKLKNASRELEDARLQLEEQSSKIITQKRELTTRQKDQEDLLWFNQGLGIFSELISKNREDLQMLCKELIEKLTGYVEAQQGGIFLYSNDNSEPCLELAASYAFSASRTNQKFAPGEGYVGVCFKDKKFIEIDNLTESYSVLGSGLGQVHIRHLLLAPLVVVDNCIGVIELGSFKKIKGYKIVFIEKLAENFASTITTEQANSRLKKLIDQSKKQAEELTISEESIRMNMEELVAAQEESSRREDELIKQAEEAATREEMLISEIESLKNQLAQFKQISES